MEERMRGSGPPQELFIYLIKGRVCERDEARFGRAFLGNWVEDNHSFLFFSSPSRDVVVDLVRERGNLEFFEEHHFTYEEWQGGGLDPLRIGNFLIVPPWNDLEADESETRIVLDPGVVFGSGLHPTTSDCLKALAYLKRHTPLGRVQDLGTGTGILALAAAFLGAEKVVAVDLNPLSVKTAQTNVKLNGLEERISVLAGDVREFAGDAADLVIANIHHDVVKDLFEDPFFREKKWFIVSGLMRSQARDLKRQLAGHDLKVPMEWDWEGTWHTLLVNRKEGGDEDDPGRG